MRNEMARLGKIGKMERSGDKHRLLEKIRELNELREVSEVSYVCSDVYFMLKFRNEKKQTIFDSSFRTELQLQPVNSS
jgi:hypothetical protein